MAWPRLRACPRASSPRDQRLRISLRCGSIFDGFFPRTPTGPLPWGEGESSPVRLRIEAPQFVERRRALSPLLMGGDQLLAQEHSRRFLSPHPSPLPWGEGEASTVGRRIERRPLLFPLPLGEG